MKKLFLLILIHLILNISYGQDGTFTKIGYFDYEIKRTDGSLVESSFLIDYFKTDSLTIFDKETNSIYLLKNYNNISDGKKGTVRIVAKNVSPNFFIVTNNHFKVYVDFKAVNSDKFSMIQDNYLYYVENLNKSYWLKGADNLTNQDWVVGNVMELPTSATNTYWFHNKEKNETGIISKGKAIDYSNLTLEELEEEDVLVKINGKETYILKGYMTVASDKITPVIMYDEYIDDLVLSFLKPICLTGNCDNGFGKGEISLLGTYEGNWINGKPHGKGTMRYAVAEYTGDFVQEKRDGTGTMKYDGGNIYSGEWKEDLYNGKGIFSYSDGSKYEGEWKEHQINGYGKFYDKDGRLLYEGEWKEGEKNGKGIYYFSDGFKYDGEWVENQYNGYGKLYNKDGSLVYEGEWKDDQTHGKGTYYDYNVNLKYYGDYENGDMVNVSKEEINKSVSYYATCEHINNKEDKKECLKALFKEKYLDLKNSTISKSELYDLCATETRIISSEYDTYYAVSATLMNNVIPKDELINYLNKFSKEERQVIRQEAQKIEDEAMESLRKMNAENN